MIKTIMILAIAVAFVAGTISTATVVSAAPPEDNPGQPFEEITALLNQIPIDVSNIISLLTDPIFGLEEIKNEIIIIDQKVDGIDDKVDGIDDKVDGIDDKVDGIDDKVDGIDDKVDGIDGDVNVIDGKVDDLIAKVDTLDNSGDSGNSGVKRMYVTLKCVKGIALPCSNVPLVGGHTEWILKLRCPADNLSCGPMIVDSVHFIPKTLDKVPPARTVVTRICVDVNKSCTQLNDSLISLGPIPVQAPLFAILAPGNILIRSAHGPVDAYFFQINAFPAWFGDVRIGVIIPDGSNVSSPTHLGDRIMRNVVLAPEAGLPQGLPGV